ncbi:Scr1 family TA system antitoxin-like transcriptional regulator [Actinomadura viridis]|uniref:helix-turn-helix domain-containing protein n=1 Tax=Actinomadura viridis TaxID=58110 RepID=UPI0036BEA1F4
MAPLPYVNPDDSLWSWLAFDLRRYREVNGQTQTEVARIIGVSKQQVHNIESGIRKLHRKQAEILDAIWDTAGHFARLLKFAKAGHDASWLKTFVEYEVKTLAIKAYALAVVDGLLQTPEYARALLVAGGLGNVDAAVDARMARQDVWSAKNPPEMWVLINESALRQPVGGPEVMRGQLAHLLAVSEWPNVWLRVVPRRAGAHMGLDGPFTLISTKREEVAYFEACGGGRLEQDSVEVRRFALKFDRIGADALSRADSRDLIKQIMETMW